MPHKHKRKADDNGDEVFDLPPTQRAAPLPAGKGRTANPRPKKRSKISNNKNDYGTDDTPKAFARLMAFKARGQGRTQGPRQRRTSREEEGATEEEQQRRGGETQEEQQ